MPSSHDTSTMRLPGWKSMRSSSVRNVSGASVFCSTPVDDDVVLGQETGHRHAVVVEHDVAATDVTVVVVERDHARRVDGELTAVTPRWVRTSTSWIPCALSAVTRAACSGSETDHGSGETPAVVTGGNRSTAGRAVPSNNRRARCSCGTQCRLNDPSLCQKFMASKAMRVSFLSIAICVSSVSWTQCGQPQRT